MTRLEMLKQKLNARADVLGTTIANVGWSGLAQKVAGLPFDFLMFDIEHGTLTIEGIEESLRICRLTDLPALVRVPDCVPHLISKALDMGADGVLLPRVESAGQVEAAINAARYFPAGRKGCGGFSNLRAEDRLSVSRYNENRLILIQMESEEGLDALPDILDKHGKQIAGVLIGPYDSSIMLGTPLDIASAKMDRFIRDVFACCAARGTSCGSFVDNASMLGRYRALGGNIFWTGTELSLLMEALGQLCEAFRDMAQEGKGK